MSGHWSEDEFRARVEAKAAELGTTVRDIMREAGLAEDTLNKSPSQGRRIDTIFKIAAAAKMTKEEALGLPPASDKAAHSRLERLALVADIAAHLYVALSRRSGIAEDDPADIVQAIVALLQDRP